VTPPSNRSALRRWAASTSSPCVRQPSPGKTWGTLRSPNLARTNLTGANLGSANFVEAHLGGADLFEAYLGRADLADANLAGANLFGAQLVEANLARTNLTGANLHGAQLVSASLSGANLSAANLHASTLVETDLTGDNLEVAQFIYLLLNNQKIRDVIDTITSKAVLILGRFTDERKAVLDAIREELRKHNYLPILFDFNVPERRDITETVSLLARMARFIVADITDPRSIPQELAVIVPGGERRVRHVRTLQTIPLGAGDLQVLLLGASDR
jgi:hypothetical protein